jgi:hypothetical protein
MEAPNIKVEHPTENNKRIKVEESKSNAEESPKHEDSSVKPKLEDPKKEELELKVEIQKSGIKNDQKSAFKNVRFERDSGDDEKDENVLKDLTNRKDVAEDKTDNDKTNNDKIGKDDNSLKNNLEEEKGREEKVALIPRPNLKKSKSKAKKRKREEVEVEPFEHCEERKWDDGKKRKMVNGPFSKREEVLLRLAICDYAQENKLTSQDLRNLIDGSRSDNKYSRAWVEISK